MKWGVASRGRKRAHFGEISPKTGRFYAADFVSDWAGSALEMVNRALACAGRKSPKELEAGVGIEPASTALQAAA